MLCRDSECVCVCVCIYIYTHTYYIYTIILILPSVVLCRDSECSTANSPMCFVFEEAKEHFIPW